MEAAWGTPPDIKVYEALGAVSDGRVELDGDTAKVWSSSRNKHYDVSYDPEAHAIMSNDNASYWKGDLGYPSIAFLMARGVIPYDEELGALMSNIAWKDINQQFKNDFAKTLAFILENSPDEPLARLAAYVADTQAKLAELSLTKLGKRTTPPSGY